jgi:hypothetical protein
MIGNVVAMMVPVKIVQDEEASEPESSPPEWIWYPVIEIGVFPGGRIISHDGRLVVVVVAFDSRGPQIFGSLRRKSFGARWVFGTGLAGVFSAARSERKIHRDADFIDDGGSLGPRNPEVSRRRRPCST